MRASSIPCVVLLTFAMGCAPDPEAEARDVLGGLAGQFGDKADGFSLSPCRWLRPLAHVGDRLSRMGLIMGIEGDGLLPALQGLAGVDLVWDLYHQEFTSSKYWGAGMRTALGPGVAGTGYIG